MTSMEELHDEVTRLSALWMRVVSTDHHKDRDCYWRVSTVWSYGEGPKFMAIHEGYVHERVYEEFPTYQDALVFLVDEIGRALADMKEWAGRDENRGDPVAEEILEILEGAE